MGFNVLKLLTTLRSKFKAYFLTTQTKQFSHFSVCISEGFSPSPSNLTTKFVQLFATLIIAGRSIFSQIGVMLISFSLCQYQCYTCVIKFFSKMNPPERQQEILLQKNSLQPTQHYMKNFTSLAKHFDVCHFIIGTSLRRHQDREAM